MRVHEIAKEFNLTSKELLAQMRGMGIEASNTLSTLTPQQVETIRRSLSAARATTTAAKPAPVVSRSAAAPAPRAAEPISTRTATLAPPAKAPPRTAEPVPAVAATPRPAIAVRPLAPAPVASPVPTGTPRSITVRGPIIVKEFAELLELKPNQLIAELMRMNIFASINERIDLKIARQVAEKRGFSLEHEKKVVEHKPVIRTEDQDVEPDADAKETLVPRPPVVTFMGHVDHGKTSLLDQIRKSRVVQSESGGITQHIGAYMVDVQDKSITFLDTPGHEAFTSMRARGANLTDIAIIVIAAEEGVMPQTREAIQHAKAAGVCIMVAINKMDLPDAKIDRVLQQLQREGLNPEQWGGDIVCCPVSAKTGAGLDHLLEMIALQAEVLELRANPHRRAQGYVIEARLEQGRGPTATVLVRRGTLKVGDAVLCGTTWGRVKAIIDDRGVQLRAAGPSAAVQCMGLVEVPDAGAEFKVMPNERMARNTAEGLQSDKRQQGFDAPTRRPTLDDLLRGDSTAEKKELFLIVKADVQGSLEAIQQSLLAIPSNKVGIKIALAGVGNITGNDVLLASASNAIILGFHVSVETGASSMAKREGVEIRLYSIIYELIDNVQLAMSGLLDPELKEKMLGQAEIRQVFELSKKGRVAGCMVVSGRITSRAKVRVRRNGQIVFQGTINTLRRFQNDASEVRDGQECGLRLDNFSDYQVSDVIEAFEIEKITQKL